MVRDVLVGEYSCRDLEDQTGKKSEQCQKAHVSCASGLLEDVKAEAEACQASADR